MDHDVIRSWATTSPDRPRRVCPTVDREAIRPSWGALMAGPSLDVRLRSTQGPSLRVARGESSVVFRGLEEGSTSVVMSPASASPQPRATLRLGHHDLLEPTGAATGRP